MSALLAQAQQMQQSSWRPSSSSRTLRCMVKPVGFGQRRRQGQRRGGRREDRSSVVDPSDVETLQDLIVGAMADASKQVTRMAQERLGSLAGGSGRRRGNRPRPRRGFRSRPDMFEGPVQDLIDELGKLPGIGPKSAQRIAFHLLSVEPPDIDRLTAVLAKVRDGVRFCAVCGNVSDNERCRICADPRRDGSQVCVVEEPKDVQAVERTREFRGRYHVLGGALDPLSGVGPDQLRIRELLSRIGSGSTTSTSPR